MNARPARKAQRPRGSARSRGVGTTTLLGLLCGVAAVAGGGWWAWQRQFLADATDDRVFETVQRRTLEIKLTTTGELQAIENVDITCPVRGQNTIVEIVPEGTSVKEGDVICRLDATAWQTKVEEATIGVRGAEGDVTWAKEQLALQESENAAKQQEAELKLRLAKLSWEEFDAGTRPAERSKAERALEMTRIARDKAEDDYNRVRALLTRGFTTATEVKEKQRLFLQAQGALSEAETDFKLLNDYKHVKQEAELRNALDQAQAALDRARDRGHQQISRRRRATCTRRSRSWPSCNASSRTARRTSTPAPSSPPATAWSSTPRACNASTTATARCRSAQPSTRAACSSACRT